MHIINWTKHSRKRSSVNAKWLGNLLLKQIKLMRSLCPVDRANKYSLLLPESL